MARTRHVASPSGLIFLDTHIAAWLYAGEIGSFSAAQGRVLETGTLCVSPMVSLELDFLHEIGRLRYGGTVILRALAGDIGLIVKTDSIAEVASAASALTWTRDPFDRLIVAHAVVCKAALVTSDALIARHFKQAIA